MTDQLGAIAGARFIGAAKRLDDIDLPRIGATIGVGEDELHMLIDVECAGSGFDAKGRPKMLFEPHVFWRELGPGAARDRAAAKGLAYPKWRRDYPADSYPRLRAAMAIDETAALRSASWGLGQILGSNHAMCGVDSPQAFVAAMLDDEERHLEAVVAFMTAAGIDDDLRFLAMLDRPTRPEDCAPIARVYNGPGYATHGYHTRLAQSHNRWRAIPDTPWDGAAVSAKPGADYSDPIPAPPPAMRPLLVRGAKGEWVRELQAALGTTVDGDFGPATERAVRGFQAARRLDVDGRVGPRTWASLDVGNPMSEPASNDVEKRDTVPAGGAFTLPAWVPAFIRNWLGESRP